MDGFQFDATERVDKPFKDFSGNVASREMGFRLLATWRDELPAVRSRAKSPALKAKNKTALMVAATLAMSFVSSVALMFVFIVGGAVSLMLVVMGSAMAANGSRMAILAEVLVLAVAAIILIGPYFVSVQAIPRAIVQFGKSFQSPGRALGKGLVITSIVVPGMFASVAGLIIAKSMETAESHFSLLMLLLAGLMLFGGSCAAIFNALGNYEKLIRKERNCANCGAFTEKKVFKVLRAIELKPVVNAVESHDIATLQKVLPLPVGESGDLWVNHCGACKAGGVEVFVTYEVGLDAEPDRAFKSESWLAASETYAVEELAALGAV